jgi:hypothetical protein
MFAKLERSRQDSYAIGEYSMSKAIKYVKFQIEFEISETELGTEALTLSLE